MKIILQLMCAGFALFLAACGGQPCDIIESSTNGLSGVKMPIQVTFKEHVSLKTERIEQAVSLSPSADVEVVTSGMRTLRIIPRTPLEHDTRYTVTLDAARLTGRKMRGTARFEFATPKLRFTCNDCWLQQAEDGASYVVKGEISSSDHAQSDFVERNFRIVGAAETTTEWEHSADGLNHRYTVRGIVPRSGESYTLKIVFDYGEEKTLDIEVPRKDEYIVIDHSVSTEPLAVVVTFSEPLKPNQNLTSLVRFDTKFRTSIDKNRLYIYPETEQTGDFEVEIGRGVLSRSGRRLTQSYTFTTSLPSRTPSIRFAGKGSVLPSSNDMSLLFESVNYRKARIRVRQIFANNLMQFFQRNYYGDSNYTDLEYVSRVVRDTTIDLADGGQARLDRTNTYSLDLSRLVAGGGKSMHLLEIKGLEPLVPTDEYDYDYYFGDYRTYRERSKAVLQSDIGIICKSSGEDTYLVYTTDLISARPRSGCRVRLYDRQNQPLSEAVTDSQGRAELRCKGEPFLAVAEADGDAAYMRIDRGTALSLSNFETGGTTAARGIKGYLFGERGVWRPGDDIFLTLIVASPDPLPENHPATLDFFNPNGQLVQSLVSTRSSDGIHTFRLATTPASPTGLWRAKAAFGGATFEKNIRVDAVKPNRMKIDMRLGDAGIVGAARFGGSLAARWLHGAPAAGAKVSLLAQLSQTPTRFKGYADYTFDDATKYFETEEREILSATTDAAGEVSLASDRLTPLEGMSPGLLSGKFTVKVFEKSGDFSIDQQIATVSPYDAYFGIAVDEQQSEWGERYLDSKRGHPIRIVLLDARGRIMNTSEKATVTVYRMDSYWWWDAASPASQARYAKNALNTTYKVLEAPLTNGRGEVTMRWSAADAGYYLIRVSSPRRAHSSTRVVCVSSSDFRGGVSSVTDAATRLAIVRDKDRYVPGDRAKITVPSSPGARALVSVESGSRVRESFWVECTERQTVFDVPVREGMAPNVYVSVTLVQPHNYTHNDAPIRLFGVIRLPVEDAAMRLQPQIEMPETVKPESEITIRVSERQGRKMSYTLALVDEGLLGLTRFATPDPYGFFNATEALGVSTWDLFDHVIGAYGGRIEQLFAIGGDAEQPNTGALKAQRFKPVVRFLGPERLGAGKTATHRIALPPYFGSVRVMVVASNGRAFGSAEKQVAVKKPLLVQTTLPRVISTDEEIDMPVTVFALEKGIGKTDVKVSVNEALSVVGPQSRSLVLSDEGEQVVTFRLRAGAKTGIAEIRVTASAADDSSVSQTELDVREPNPRVSLSEGHLLEAGQTLTLKPLKATAEGATLELSSIPPVDLSRRLEYLVRYPHGCVEQITSGAFPQLYLPAIMECEGAAMEDIDRNIKSVLSRLGGYQLSSGGFAYWSGGNSVSEWGTVYVAHFMTEARKYGYGVDRTMFERTLDYLGGGSLEHPLAQAYAQYVLALNGSPDRGAMNRLREKADGLGSDVKWLLAAAYALDGNRKVAAELTERAAEAPAAKADPYDGTYNSPERQMSIVLLTQTLIGQREAAFRTALRISDILQSDRWLSTQSAAWMLSTFANFAATGQRGIDARAGRETVRTDKSILSLRLTRETEVKNNAAGTLYAVVSQSYTPSKGEETEAASGIRLSVRYKDMDGAPLDPGAIPVSTEFYAVATVTNISGFERYTNLALTHIVPAGWEIASERDLSQVDYQDIRDDRVLSYFDLKRGESLEIPIRLTATYKGRFYLPSVYCEAMYDHSVRALCKGEWIEVVE